MASCCGRRRPSSFLFVLFLTLVVGRAQALENKTELEVTGQEENATQTWEDDFGLEGYPNSTDISRDGRDEDQDYDDGKQYDPDRPNTILVVGPPKRGRFFPSLFSVVKFPRIPCMAAVGLTGTCFTKKQCRVVGGTIYGPCARGYGVCCIVRRSCDAVGGLNRTYFANPEYPGTTHGNQASGCTLTMTRPSRPRICQVRLDFHEFFLTPPRNGDCLQDRLLIHGQSVNSVVPPLCGLNSGQHVFFDLDEGRMPFTLTVITSGEGQRKWNIGINLIECVSPSRAPPNCLQYFMGPSGIFSSFNYVPGAPPGASGGYLNNMDYSICFRKESSHCGQRYTVFPKPQDDNDNDQSSFDLMNVNAGNAPIVGSSQAGLGIQECPDDFLLLAGVRFCGTRLNPSPLNNNPTENAPVFDFGTGPLIARFMSNSAVNSGGFQLSFSQQPCLIGGQQALLALQAAFGFPVHTLPAAVGIAANSVPFPPPRPGGMGPPGFG